MGTTIFCRMPKDKSKQHNIITGLNAAFYCSTLSVFMMLNVTHLLAIFVGSHITQVMGYVWGLRRKSRKMSLFWHTCSLFSYQFINVCGAVGASPLFAALTIWRRMLLWFAFWTLLPSGGLLVFLPWPHCIEKMRADQKNKKKKGATSVDKFRSC